MDWNWWYKKYPAAIIDEWKSKWEAIEEEFEAKIDSLGVDYLNNPSLVMNWWRQEIDKAGEEALKKIREG
jgi:hypothetical protein